MESTRENLPERLRAFHALAKDRPALAVAAPIIEAAEEIERLRRIESAAFTVVNADAQSDHQHVIDEWISELRKTLAENR